MKEPTHNIKTTPWHKFTCGLSPWDTHQMPCWLGSGVKDKNDKEIFEGDRVKFGELGNTGTVVFRNAMFVIDHDHSDKFTVLGNTVGFVDVEVVGHITLEDTQ